MLPMQNQPKRCGDRPAKQLLTGVLPEVRHYKRTGRLKPNTRIKQADCINTANAGSQRQEEGQK